MTRFEYRRSTSPGPEVYGILSSTPNLLRDLTAVVPQLILEGAADNAWSAHHVIAHLVDTDGAAFADRIRRMLTEERPFIRSIDPTARVEAGGYAGLDVATLLERLSRQRGEYVPWLQSLGAGELSRVGDHDTAGEISVGNIVHYWAFHDLLHLQQVAKTLQAHLVDGLGGTRDFLDT